MTNKIFKAVFQYPMLILACVIALAQAYRASVVGVVAFVVIAAIICTLLCLSRTKARRCKRAPKYFNQ